MASRKKSVRLPKRTGLRSQSHVQPPGGAGAAWETEDEEEKPEVKPVHFSEPGQDMVMLMREFLAGQQRREEGLLVELRRLGNAQSIPPSSPPPLSRDRPVPHLPISRSQSQASLSLSDRHTNPCWPADAVRGDSSGSGKAVEAYSAMDEERAHCYGDLKEALLAKFDISPETYCQQFFSSTQPSGESPTETYHRLRGLYCRWIRPEERTKKEVGEAIIMEQLLRVFPFEVRTWVKEREPGDGLTAAKLAVQYLNALKGGPARTGTTAQRRPAQPLLPRPPRQDSYPDRQGTTSSAPNQRGPGWYRRFVPQFATIAAPLTALTAKNQRNPVVWTEPCEKAFTTLKAHLCSSPVLKSPDFNMRFLVQVDASTVGL
uniref:SCAN box domain-containing protein n=1 Tax=Knipowitschia caucasica TaxID=637954 RepID=A0AAV2J255_KNICA